MPPVRSGRASKACAACRKQKTRCLDGPNSHGSCLRCTSLSQLCSLTNERSSDSVAPGGNGHVPTDNQAAIEARFERLENALNSLTELVHASLATSTSTSEANGISHTTRPEYHVGLSSLEAQQETDFAPVIAIRDVAQEVGLRRRENNSHLEEDIVIKGVVTYAQAVDLVEIFIKHYGRWIGLDELVLADTAFFEMRTSPLLLCASCIIAVRHTSQEQASLLAPVLFEEAKRLLSEALLQAPQPLEFFQAAVILSLWSTTIGQIPLSIDGWLLTSFSIQHAQACKAFDVLYTESGSENCQVQTSTWNHLCLAHLQYCVGTRRRALLRPDDIQRCVPSKESLSHQNFEPRMIAEINLYWILHQSSKVYIDLPAAQNKLQDWKKEWAYLFDQQRSQFLRMGYYFAELLLYHLSLNSRSTAVRESLLLEMIRVSRAVIEIAIDTADERTCHLTDHIYHMMTFAAVTLCRLLSMYEHQVANSVNVQQLDDLIVKLATWLHTIGLPCHIAHFLGDVIFAFHRKLRPGAHLVSDMGTSMNQTTPEDLTFFFPEVLGLESFGNSMEDLLPDWEPFISEST